MYKERCGGNPTHVNLENYSGLYSEYTEEELALFLSGCPDCPFWEGHIAPTQSKCKPKVEYGKTKGSKRVKATVSPREK